MIALLFVAALDVFDRYECARCHVLPDRRAVTLDKQCVGCHRAIIARTFRGASSDTLAAWDAHLVSLRSAPALDGATRWRRSWLKKFLLEPYDLRPGLPATMPRLAVAEADADLLASRLGAASEEPAEVYSVEQLDRGRELYSELKCASCHHDTGDAPELRHARDRLRPRMVREVVKDPKRSMRSASMPAYAISEEEAIALEAFVMTAPLPEVPPDPIPERLAILTRRVGFDEVNRNVFKKTCWHCHSDPALARGDGGPGNTGGFGFAPRGLSFASAAEVNEGMFDENGDRRSIADRLLPVLLARQHEERGAPLPNTRGMPLGLPALTPEQIQLVETWLAQGRPE